MIGRIFGACGLCVVLSGVSSAQVVTYYQPAYQPVYQPTYVPAVPRATYYAPSVSIPATTYYAPSAAAQTVPGATYDAQPAAAQYAPVTTYYAPPVQTQYAPVVTYYAPPATMSRVNMYHSSVSSMPVGSVSSAGPVYRATPVPVGAPPVATLAPPVIAYRPVMAVPQSYVMTRGLFGRPHLYPVNPAPLVPVYVP